MITKQDKRGQQWLKTQRSRTMETLHNSEIDLYSSRPGWDRPSWTPRRHWYVFKMKE